MNLLDNYVYSCPVFREKQIVWSLMYWLLGNHAYFGTRSTRTKTAELQSARRTLIVQKLGYFDRSYNFDVCWLLLLYDFYAVPNRTVSCYKNNVSISTKKKNRYHFRNRWLPSFVTIFASWSCIFRIRIRCARRTNVLATILRFSCVSTIPASPWKSQPSRRGVSES